MACPTRKRHKAARCGARLVHLVPCHGQRTSGCGVRGLQQPCSPGSYISPYQSISFSSAPCPDGLTGDTWHPCLEVLQRILRTDRAVVVFNVCLSETAASSARKQHGKAEEYAEAAAPVVEVQEAVKHGKVEERGREDSSLGNSTFNYQHVFL